MDTPDISARKTRYETIDIAKAFAIVLVVIGHFDPSFMPGSYKKIVEIIYLFHMPLFMFCSGFLYQATWRPQKYSTFIRRKFQRLMIPYLTCSILILCLKLLSADTLSVESPVTPMSFVEILYLPAAGYFLWFIWALWWNMMIIPFFKTSGQRLMLLITAIPLHFLAPQMPEIFCLKQFADMMVFFCAGTVMADYMKRKHISSFSLKWHILSIITFILLSTILNSGLLPKEAPYSMILTFIANLSGIAMFITLSYYWKKTAGNALLRATYSIAASSYLIYLLHTTLEGLAKAILYKIGWFDLQPQSLTIWLGAASVILTGVAVPWLLAKFIISKSKPLAFLFGTQYRPTIKS